jgi:dipeptidyl-peptidase 4
MFVNLQLNYKLLKIYNGIPDWVYEEEVLSTDAATWFSPNGNHFAFAQFNDTKVKEAVYDVYGDKQYPEEVHLRYPKVRQSYILHNQ